MADVFADVRFEPYGFRPVGGSHSHLVEPARCPCGITAQYASRHFGFLCAPCYRAWAAGQGAAPPVGVTPYPDPIPREDQDYDGARRPHGPRPGVSTQAVRPATETGDDAEP